MFQVLAWHSELILDLWTSPKRDLEEAEKAMIQVVECHFEVIFCFSTNLKCYFFQVDKAMIQVVDWHFFLLTSQNSTLVRSRNRCF